MADEQKRTWYRVNVDMFVQAPDGDTAKDVGDLFIESAAALQDQHGCPTLLQVTEARDITPKERSYITAMMKFGEAAMQAMPQTKGV
jgi:hypothetical protein